MVAVSASTTGRASAKRAAPAKRATAKRATSPKRTSVKRSTKLAPPKKAAENKPIPANPAPYLVRPGQTWDDIGKLHNLSGDQLQVLNPGVNTPKAGMRVKVK